MSAPSGPGPRRGASAERVEVEVGGRRLVLSNLDKVLYPSTGTTKAQVVDYYRQIAPVMLPHLAGRGLTLVRFPNGVESEGFYEKNCPQHRPAWMPTAKVKGRSSGETVEFCVVEELAALVWLANLAALELHSPMARATAIDHPTAVVFDLDPGPPADLADACRLGRALRDLLVGLGLQSFPKTSGKKGLHVYVPLNPPDPAHAPTYLDTRDFAHAIAQLLAKGHPGVITVMERAKREGKVFIDWSQNARHKTTVAPYSLRATAAPSVSTPLSWDEVEAGAGTDLGLTSDPGRVVERVAERGDLFAPVLDLVQALPARGSRVPAAPQSGDRARAAPQSGDRARTSPADAGSKPQMTPAASLRPRIEDAAQTGGVVTFITGDSADRVEWGRLHDDARGVASALQARGVGPGNHVGLLAGTSRALVTTIEAVWLCGATVVVLPLPMRLSSIEEFVQATRRRIRRADTTLLVADPALLEFWSPEPGDPPVALLGDLSGDGSGYEQPAEDPEALAILQFTSGSTADPKGVMLPHRCVTANLDAIAAAAHLDPADDVIVSWLPLYHDMGLIGTLTLPMATGTNLVLAAPQDFLASPRRWMEWMSAFRGTATAGPNFSYALAARALGRLDGLDLSRWRLALNGAEPVDPLSVEAFCAAGRRHGLDPRAAYPAFGMAEATLAVTFPEPGSGLVIDRIDRRALEHAGEAIPTGADDPIKARDVTLLGAPVPGLEVRVVDPSSGQSLAERLVGEIQIRGTSVTPGYYRDAGATTAAFDGNWLRTGDLGYLADGQLAVCGRLKDVIIVGGRNVFPEDAERAAASVEGVRAGNVIAFGTDGRRGEELVVVAETRLDDRESPEHSALRDEVRDAVARRVREALGLPARDIVLVRPGTLPKTSSGKLQRSLCRERYRTQALEPV